MGNLCCAAAPSPPVGEGKGATVDSPEKPTVKVPPPTVSAKPVTTPTADKPVVAASESAAAAAAASGGGDTAAGSSALPEEAIKSALRDARRQLEKNAMDSFAESFVVGKLIGHGAFAKVMQCTHKDNDRKLAVKSVQKNLEDPAKQREGIIKEIAIMSILQDHPNTVRLHDVYEDKDSYHLVMELCDGGELFDQIISKGHFTEKDAAEKMRCLLEFIAFAHSKNIIHRDLKPENILLSDKTATAVLKVIDFGTSDFCMDGQRLQQKFGTPYYVAPEVLKKDYHKAADIWSCGVILYILLCGYPPFGGKTDPKILQRVQAGMFAFEGREWEVVTDAAKELITQMLVMDIHKRATAHALLQHKWFQVAATAPAAALGAHMVRRLKTFAGMSRLKRLALVVLARTLTDNDVKRLRELFMAMDNNADGRIDSNDLHRALEKVGAAIEEGEMRELFTASDIDGTGQIDYEEFIAAMLDSSRVAKRKEAVRKSFEELDRDGDGFITADDLVKVMPRGSSIELAREIVKEVDKNRTGRVDYKEFTAIMQAGA